MTTNNPLLAYDREALGKAAYDAESVWLQSQVWAGPTDTKDWAAYDDEEKESYRLIADAVIAEYRARPPEYDREALSRIAMDAFGIARVPGDDATLRMFARVVDAVLNTIH